jgi:hypothetical protein
MGPVVGWNRFRAGTLPPEAFPLAGGLAIDPRRPSTQDIPTTDLGVDRHLPACDAPALGRAHLGRMLGGLPLRGSCSIRPTLSQARSKIASRS